MSNSLSTCILVEAKKKKHIRLQKLCKHRIRSFDTVNTVIKRGDDIEGLYSSTWFDFNILYINSQV